MLANILTNRYFSQTCDVVQKYRLRNAKANKRKQSQKSFSNVEASYAIALRIAKWKKLIPLQKHRWKHASGIVLK